MIDLIAALLILGGAFFSIVAAVGIVRLPDVYIRMHAATKAGLMGGGLIMLAVAVHAGTLDVVFRAIAAILFLLLTAPVAAHLLGRSAYLTGVKMWEGTACDHLEGKYNPISHDLAGLKADHLGSAQADHPTDLFPAAKRASDEEIAEEMIPRAEREAARLRTAELALAAQGVSVAAGGGIGAVDLDDAGTVRVAANPKPPATTRKASSTAMPQSTTDGPVASAQKPARSRKAATVDGDND